MPFTIEEASRATSSYQALVVATVTLQDASVRRWSTHPLNSAEGGAAPVISGWAHSGQSIEGRMITQDLGQIASSETGVDQLQQINFAIADPDASLYSAIKTSGGLQGASCDAWLFYWSVGTSEFSTDVRRIFVGKITGAQASHEIRIEARSRLDLSGLIIPTKILAPECQHMNPRTTTERADADNADSPFFGCGATGAPGTELPCSYTPATCTRALRFSGFAHQLPKSFEGNAYVQKGVVRGDNGIGNLRAPVPWVYGVAWVKPPLVGPVGDPNSDRGEFALCDGAVDGAGDTDPGFVQHVVVNGTEIPFVRYRQDVLRRWQWITTGTRDGSRNLDIPWNGEGNPYGGMAVILVVVNREIAEPGSTPDVRVLMSGHKVRIYTDGSTFTTGWSNNPAWILLDILVRSGRRYADFDLATWVPVAARCGATITGNTPEGGTFAHERVAVGFAITDRANLKDIADGLMATFDGRLTLEAGLICLRQSSTLAVQQSAPVAGSNYLTAVTSQLQDGTAANGYYAYSVDEEAIQIDSQNKHRFEIIEASDRIINRLQVSFSRRSSRYAGANLTYSDSSSIGRVGRREGQARWLGITSSDLAARLCGSAIARSVYGNASNDPRGTEVYEFWTDTRCAHLRPGDIIRVKCAPQVTAFIPARVEVVRLGTNAVEVFIRATYHRDAWYLDSIGSGYGAVGAGLDFDSPSLPGPWRPNEQAPITGDALIPATEKTFSVEVVYESDADGAPVPVVHVTGEAPVSGGASTPPTIAAQLSIATTGGSIVGSQRQYWARVAAVVAGGQLSMLSGPATAVITTSGSAHTLTVSTPFWPTGATAYRVYAGSDPLVLSLAASGSGTPSSIVISAIPARGEAPPDAQADHLEVYARTVAHSGVWAAAANDVLANVIEITGASWTTNQWAGRIITVPHRAAGGLIHVANFSVTSNNSNQLTVSPNPVGIVAIGDLVVMRSKPTVSGLTLTDALWANGLSGGGAGLVVNEEKGRELAIIAGTGAGYSYLIASNTATAITVVGPWLVTPDTTSVYVVLDSDTGVSVERSISANGVAGAKVSAALEMRNAAGRVVMISADMIGRDGRRNVANLSPRREIYIAGDPGPDGGGGGSPPTVAFTAATREYGGISIEDTVVTGAGGLGPLQSVAAELFAVDETTSDVCGEFNAAVGTGGGLIVGLIMPTRITPTSVLDFAVGQFVVVNDPGAYEVMKITAISGSDFTFDRAQLGSTIASHAGGTRVYILQRRKFSWSPASAAISTTVSIADRLRSEIPNHCVVAARLTSQFGGETGPSTTSLLSTATVPGLRTLDGAVYRLKIGGTLAVNLTSEPWTVQYASSIRVIFGRVLTAPTGAALAIAIEQSADNGGTWASISSISIAASAKDSFDFSTAPPGARRVPYAGSWPFAILRPNDLLRLKVTAIGSTVAGADLVVEVHV